MSDEVMEDLKDANRQIGCQKMHIRLLEGKLNEADEKIDSLTKINNAYLKVHAEKVIRLRDTERRLTEASDILRKCVTIGAF